MFSTAEQVRAQIEKVDGYDGYKFGMTIDQAKRVKPSAKQTRCEYASGPMWCLEYATRVSDFPAEVTVQFPGATPLLTQILVTFRSLPDNVPRYSCREVGKEILKLLIAKYETDALLKGHTVTWTSPHGGSVSLTSLCVGEVEGINVVTYRTSNPL